MSTWKKKTGSINNPSGRKTSKRYDKPVKNKIKQRKGRDLIMPGTVADSERYFGSVEKNFSAYTVADLRRLKTGVTEMMNVPENELHADVLRRHINAIEAEITRRQELKDEQ